jgi:DNA-binding transcriptional LysR family regulator
MDLNDVRLFVQVVDQGGFAAAARRLAMAKSTLSKRIAALEASLGARLLQRTSRQFSITPVGQAFAERARAMLLEAEAAEAVVRRHLAGPSGVVRVTASMPTVQHRFPAVLKALAARLPGVILQVHASDRFVDMVREGFDIAVRDHFAPLPDSDCVQRPLASEPVWLVASPAYLEKQGVPEVPSDLGGHNGLLVSHDKPTWFLVDDSSAVHEIRPQPRMFVDEAAALLAAARSGLGVAALPRSHVEGSIDDGHLRRVLSAFTGGEVRTTLLMPHRRGQMPAVRAVLDELAKQWSGAESTPVAGSNADAILTLAEQFWLAAGVR